MTDEPLSASGNADREAWEDAWSGELYEDAIAFITSQSGQAELAVEFGAISADSHVLDVGCGPGTLSEILAGLAASVEGIDFLPTMIEQAKRRRSSANFQVADAEALPFGDRDFDVAVCCYTAHHFARPEKVFGELLRVLRPGGRVVVLHPIQSQTVSFRSIYASLEAVLPSEQVADFPAMEGPLYAVDTPEPYLEVLTDAGFTTVSAEHRIKPCTVADLDTLVTVTAQIGQIDLRSVEMRSELTDAVQTTCRAYEGADNSYCFPDALIVATGVRS